MKNFYYLLLFVFSVPTALFAQWQAGNVYDILQDKGKSIKDFVISEDSKYIYTVSDSAVITKWDFATGDSISSRKIEFPENLAKADKWLFLSSDAKTYITVGFHVAKNGNTEFVASIFDINTNDLIDTISTQHDWELHFNGYSYKYVFRYDYLTAQKWLFLAIANKFHQTWASDEYNTGGAYQIYYKNDTAWTLKLNIRVHPCNFTYNDKYFFFSFFSSYSLYDHNYRSYMSSESEGNSVFDIIADKYFEISKYSSAHKYDPYNGYTDEVKGQKIPVNSSLLVNDSIYLQYKNYLKVYDLKSREFKRNLSLGEYKDNDTLRLSVLLNKFYYLITKSNELNVHGTANHKQYISVGIDSADLIVKALNNKKREYVIFLDAKGDLFRINYNKLVKLNANFQSEKRKYLAGDTVKFINLSMGNPSSFLWDFGDGTTSTEKEPLHVYTDTGYFDVKLMIFNGNASDTVVKKRYLHVLPRIICRIAYKTVYNDSKATIVIWNETKEKSDSLQWLLVGENASFANLINKSNPKVDTFKIETSVGGSFNIKLNFYKFNIKYSEDTIIGVNIPEKNITEDGFKSEYTYKKYPYLYAVTGYEDKEDNLIYLIKNGNLSYYGLLKNGESKWVERSFDTHNYIFRRSDSIYTFAGQKTVYNFDKGHNIFDKMEELPDFGFKKYTCTNSNLVVIEANQTNYYHSVYAYNINNKIDKKKDVFTTRTEVILGNITSRMTGKYWDDIISIKRYITYNNDIPTGYGSLTYIDRSRYLYIPFIDMIRLNDSLLIILCDSYFYTYTPANKELLKFDLPFYNLRDIKRLSADKFVIAGAKNEHPAYWIYNQKGELVLSKEIKERYGYFNQVTITGDENLLFSGASLMEYPVYYPYFVKFKGPFVKEEKEIFPDFSYDIKYYKSPVELILTNTTKDKVDSLKWQIYNGSGGWQIINNKDSYAETVKLTFDYDTTIRVKLVVYKNIFTYSKEKIITVTIPESVISNKYFISEYTDIKYKNFEAFKAYENKHGIMCHIKSINYRTNVSYYGFIKTDDENWGIKSNYYSYLFKNSMGDFLFYDSKNITKYNSDGGKITAVEAKSYQGRTSATCRDSNLVIFLPDKTTQGTMLKYDVYDTNLNLKNQDSIKPVPDYSYFFDCHVLSKGGKINYLYRYAKSDNTTGAVLNDIDATNVFPVKQMIKLNKKDFILLGDNQIRIDYIKYHWDFYNMKEMPDWEFKSVEKINDSLFIVTGSKDMHPGYLIFDNHLQLLWKELLKERRGKFNFVSITENNDFLLSGYEITNKKEICPYFVKMQSPELLIDSLQKTEDAIYDIKCYPNPFKSYINIYILSNLNTNAYVKIYDAMGELVMEPQEIQLSFGQNTFELNIDKNIAVGKYFMIVEIGSDKIVYPLIHL